MKLKYYLRGLGIGMIVTALILGGTAKQCKTADGRHTGGNHTDTGTEQYRSGTGDHGSRRDTGYGGTGDNSGTGNYSRARA